MKKALSTLTCLLFSDTRSTDPFIRMFAYSLWSFFCWWRPSRRSCSPSHPSPDLIQWSCFLLPGLCIPRQCPYIPPGPPAPPFTSYTLPFSPLNFVKNCLLICAGFLPPLLHFLFIEINPSWAWRMWSLKVNQLSWICLLSRAISYGIFFKQIPEESEVCSPESQGCNPAFNLLWCLSFCLGICVFPINGV